MRIYSMLTRIFPSNAPISSAGRNTATACQYTRGRVWSWGCETLKFMQVCVNVLPSTAMIDKRTPREGENLKTRSKIGKTRLPEYFRLELVKMLTRVINNGLT